MEITTWERETGLHIYRPSVVEIEGSTYFLARGEGHKWLGVVGETSGFEGERRGSVLVGPLSPANAETLRTRLPWLRPQRLGLQTSVGCGDRLGLATPGHVRAVRTVGGIAPIFAQQSVRENARTGRTPRQVMDEAIWGLFQEGWRDPWGADADHLKTEADVAQYASAGYTFFTIDPGEHVDDAAHTAPLHELEAKVRTLPWDVLADSPDGMRARYVGRHFEVGPFTLTFDEESYLRAAAKYGRAIAHTVRLYRLLTHRALAFELEMSVDETATPTSAQEHYLIARELKRLGVRWVSLAPRYIGRFEKGVDYIGDLATFELELARHAAIARTLGPYKLSLHSGSDKFTIYPLVARQTGGLVHLKTAGTSYLEALRAIAQVAPDLFRRIVALAQARYETDRATYHVSASLDRLPDLRAMSDDLLPRLLEQFDARQVLHVTFGSVLATYGEELRATLAAHEEAHYTALAAHFIRHLSLLRTP